MLIHAFVQSSERSRVFGLLFTSGAVRWVAALCWKPETRPFSSEERTIAAVIATILSAHRQRPFEGVAFSGGEPMQQALMKSIHDRMPVLTFGIGTPGIRSKNWPAAATAGALRVGTRIEFLGSTPG
jgi:hypothetical protein